MKRAIKPLLAAGLSAAMLLGTAAWAATPAPEGVRVYFIDIADGDRLESPFTLRFGLSGMGVAPAGVDMPKTGHHHLLIDVDTPPAAGTPIPADEHHVHFGAGQTEAQIELAPGTHTLQLLLGDAFHRPHEPAVMSEKITVTVE
jgi:hypothetical protein